MWQSPPYQKTVTNNKEFTMSQKKCFRVVKSPRTVGVNSGELVGSFDNKDDAEKCKEKESSKIDKDHFIIEIH